ncbi:MAG: hypothetical protein V1858_05120 [Candidatus Gottesmanbacteria bacterium]
MRPKKKYSKLFWIFTIGICVILSGLAFLGFSISKQFDDAVASIQSNLVDAANAKIVGDLVRRGTQIKGETMETVEAKAMTSAKNLSEVSVPDDLKNYQAVASIWSIRIAAAASQSNGWVNLKNQPDPFPLVISDIKASNLLKPILKNISDLKTEGSTAIQNKDRDAMRQIAAKLIVQNHFLNAILHSQEEEKTTLIPFALAAGSTLQSIPDVKGVDVTCSICDYPDAYKVHWTDALKKQYGCDSRCHKQNQPVQEEVKYSESLSSYSYSDSKRVVCTNTNKSGSFCVEKAAQVTNELIDAAIGFTEGSRNFTVEQWNGAVAYATGEVGTPPSWPSAEGGHKEGGMGTINQGDPNQPQQNTNSRSSQCEFYNKDCPSIINTQRLACALGSLGDEDKKTYCDSITCASMYQNCLNGKEPY